MQRFVSLVGREVEDTHVSALNCLFLASPCRGRDGAAAIDHARACGARYRYACPIDRAKQSKSVILHIGSTAIFDAAGFEIVARRKHGRPLMRLDLRQ